MYFKYINQKIHSGLIRLESEEKFSYVILQKRALTKYEKGKADREGTQLINIIMTLKIYTYFCWSKCAICSQHSNDTLSVRIH